MGTHYFVIFSTLVGLLGLCYGNGYYYPYGAAPAAPTVTTKTGCVRGDVVRLPNSDVSVFLGIPYAKPPVEINRFKKPFPVKGWSGILDATIKPPSCMQYSPTKFPWLDQENTSEDCLYLNIWVPCGQPSEYASKFPVMVWIHGGGFQYGSGGMDVYDGSTLAASTNVIVVTMNYRMGVFGFFDAGSESASGNMGLLDQTMAMQWVKDNIRYFGGNPDMITLFGESAGSISVGLHMVSPISRNLFKRAIMQSGSPYHPLLSIPPMVVKAKGEAFAAKVGCSNETSNLYTDPEGVTECLRNINGRVLAEVDAAFLVPGPFYFIPTYGNEFLPKPAMEYILSGDIKDCELLIGIVKDEGSLFLNFLMPQIFGQQYVQQLNQEDGGKIIYSLFQNSTSTADVVARFYLRNNPQDSLAVAKSVYDSFGDYLLACPTLLFAKKAKNDVYFYHFTHRPTNSYGGDWMGTTHFDEVPFVFGAPISVPHFYTAEEGRFSHNIMQKWASFARSGSPTGMVSGEYWPKFTSTNPRYLELNPRSRKVGSAIKEEECEFWQKHYFPNPEEKTRSVKI